MDKKKINIRSIVRIILVSAVTITFFVGIILVYYNMLYNEKRGSIIKDGKNTALQTANEFNEYLISSLDSIKIISYAVDDMISENKTNEEILDYLVWQSNVVKSTTVESTTGIYGYINGEYLDGDYWVPPDDYIATERPWYKDATADPDNVSVVDPYVDMQTGAVMITLAKTLSDGKSVVAMDIALTRIQEITEEAVNPETGHIEFIVDRTGYVVSHSDINEVGKNYLTESGTLGSDIMKKYSGSGEAYFELNYGGLRYIVYCESLSNDWLCVSANDMTKPFGSLGTILIVTIVVIILVISVIGGILRNSFNRRLKTEHLGQQLSSTADIYISVHEIDFINDTFSEIRNNKHEASDVIGECRSDCQNMIRTIMTKFSDDSTRENVLDFVDFSKLDARLKDCNTITCDFLSSDGKWRKSRFIVSGRLADGRVSNAMYLIEDIDKEISTRNAALETARTLNYRVSSISNIYMTVHEIEIAADTFTEIKSDRRYIEDLEDETHANAQQTFYSVVDDVCDPSCAEDVHRFIDMSTVEKRLGKNNTITIEYMNKQGLWRRGRIIASRRDENGKLTHVMWLIEDINDEKTERDKLTQAAERLGNRISTISNIYLTVHEFDLAADTYTEIKNGHPRLAEIVRAASTRGSEMLRTVISSICDRSCVEDVLKFCDLSTIGSRMKNTDTIATEYLSKENKWYRGRFIVSVRSKSGKVTRVLYLSENIDGEKAERDKLIDMSERAIAASEAKSSFLSNMSHEIRTPINAVLGMNEMILRECDDRNILGYSESIRTAGTTLLGLVNDILDFSKIEAGKMEIIPVDYDLSSVINDLVGMIQTKADNKGLRLDLNISGDVPKILHGDEVRVKQVITNILTNAVKYTEKGFITFGIGYEKLPDEPDSILLNVSIKDTGIGIKKEDMRKLFSEFDRIEEKRNRNIEGTGLGMSITQRLLEMMDSSLIVESIYGLGSKFSFSLKQTVVNWEALGDYEAAYRESLGRREKYHEKFRAPSARVLVVDDTPMNLVVFANLLKQTEVKIDTANSGSEGLSRSLETKYDIIFLDHMMPEKDGIQTLRELKAQTDNPNLNTPVICLTANAISGAREKYLADGFDNYLTKPIDSGKLEEMLIKYLPSDKITQSGDTEADSAASAAEAVIDDNGSQIPVFIHEISEIDCAKGITNCGSEEAFLETLKLFAGMVNGYADEIGKYWESGDIKNAVIKIHALKSSSRIIGASELGELAQELENAGNAGDMEKLGAHIADLLGRYRSLGEALAPMLQTEEDADLPMLGEEELSEIYTGISEFMSVSDFGSAVDLIENLKEYSFPESEKERCKTLIKAAEEIDYDTIAEIMQKGE